MFLAGGHQTTRWIAPSMPTTELQINDLFWTLQGEGHFSGRRALFVRLPYCNYDCPWCDTEYNSFKKWSEEDFTKFIKKERARFAVITGGEPLAHKQLPKILGILKAAGFTIACETNGSIPAPEAIDFVTTSPKAYTKNKFEAYYVAPENFQRTSEWKYVVDDDFDFSILDRHQTHNFIEKNIEELSQTAKTEEVSKTPLNTQVTVGTTPLTTIESDHNKKVYYSLSPEFNNMEKNVERIINYIQKNPQWQLSLQTHKWINIP